MKEKLVITIIGPDKTGIVAGISKKMTDFNMNIVDINQTIFDGAIFSMMMLVEYDGKTTDMDYIKLKLDELGKKMEMKISFEEQKNFINKYKTGGSLEDLAREIKGKV